MCVLEVNPWCESDIVARARQIMSRAIQVIVMDHPSLSDASVDALDILHIQVWSGSRANIVHRAKRGRHWAAKEGLTLGASAVVFMGAHWQSPKLLEQLYSYNAHTQCQRRSDVEVVSLQG